METLGGRNIARILRVSTSLLRKLTEQLAILEWLLLTLGQLTALEKSVVLGLSHQLEAEGSGVASYSIGLASKPLRHLTFELVEVEYLVLKGVNLGTHLCVDVIGLGASAITECPEELLLHFRTYHLI